jgi:putative ABC transport system permease protein
VFNSQDENSHAPLAVISYSLWSERYQRDPRVIGAVINLDRKAYTIIGVMPRDFELQAGRLNQVQVWVPMSFSADELSDQQAGFFGHHIVARLKKGVTFAKAASDADRVVQQVMRSYPPTMSAIKIRGAATPLHEQLVSDVRPMLRTLFIALAVVLLIACVNVAGLLLVRAIRRRREFAIRLALGARSQVIIRESLLESLLLSLAGGLLG